MPEYIEREVAKEEIMSWAVRIFDPKSLSTEDTMYVLDRIPAADVVAVETVAQMFFDFTGDKCPCNFNDTAEWLPFYCEYEAAGKCPDPDESDELACWKQYIKHYERREEDE